MIDTRKQLSDMYLCKSNCALNSRGMKKREKVSQADMMTIIIQNIST